MSDLEPIKSNMKYWSEVAKDNSLIYGDYLDNGVKVIERLEQQLSNSISKDELRGLVDELRAIENRDNNPRDQHLVGASLGAGMAANKLNKLIEGDNNG